MKYPVLITFLLLIFSVWSDGNEISQPDYNLDNRHNPYTSLGNRENLSSQYGSPVEAQNLVEKAVDYVNANGQEKSIQAFHNNDSVFFYKDLYIFMIDMEGNVLAHGGDISLAGTNQLNLRDSVGRYFIREFIDLMQNNSKGWLDYKWRNYQTHEIETKMSYLQKVDDQLFIGCGIYYGK